MRIIEAKDMLGFQPKNTANWIIAVGNDDRAIFIMGCRVHYAMLCNEPPIGQNVLRMD